MTTLVFPYKPRPALMVFVMVVFAVFGWVAVHKAQSPHGGLVIMHLVRLGIDGATRFYWGLAATCAVLVAFGALAFWTGLKSRNRLVLTDTRLSVPTWAFSTRCKEVPLAKITRLDEREYHGQRMLTVHYTGGKVTIARQMLPNEEAYEDVVAVLEAVLHGSRDDAGPIAQAKPAFRAVDDVRRP
jgi:hypothetical protein